MIRTNRGGKIRRRHMSHTSLFFGYYHTSLFGIHDYCIYMKVIIINLGKKKQRPLRICFIRIEYVLNDEFKAQKTNSTLIPL